MKTSSLLVVALLARATAGSAAEPPGPSRAGRGGQGAPRLRRRREHRAVQPVRRAAVHRHGRPQRPRRRGAPERQRGVRLDGAAPRPSHPPRARPDDPVRRLGHLDGRRGLPLLGHLPVDRARADLGDRGDLDPLLGRPAARRARGKDVLLRPRLRLPRGKRLRERQRRGVPRPAEGADPPPLEGLLVPDRPGRRRDGPHARRPARRPCPTPRTSPSSGTASSSGRSRP